MKRHSFVLAVALAGLPLVPRAPLTQDPAPPRMAVRELPADTVVEARSGDVLQVETWQGSLTVRVGDDGQVRLASTEDAEGVGIARSGRTLQLATPWRSNDGDLVLEIPAWMPVRVQSRSLDLDVTGVEGGVTVRVLEGDIRLRNVAGGVVAETLDGEIDGTRLAGDMTLSTLDGDVQLWEVRGGRVRVESTEGDLELEDVEGTEVSAVTVDGDVGFRGRILGAGSLTLAAHDGDVRAWLPRELQAQVEVSTFDGSFESDFPVRTGGFRAGRPLQFTVGGGGNTRVVLQSFDGDIRLLSW